jgi:hypothetical protein
MSETTEPVHYDIQPGDTVELTLRGVFDGRQIQTAGYSFFELGAGTRQVDPDVWVRVVVKNK